jgi:2-iminobutanoate/2-iminopropanoate deaminase
MPRSPVFHMVPGAAQPVAPYSHAVEVGDWILLTGQVPNDPPNDKAPLPPDIEGQTRRTMENLRLVLKGLGLDLANLVSARVFLTHFEADYERMNAVYRGYFAPDRLPARTCIGVTALARGARIEIDAVARRS